MSNYGTTNHNQGRRDEEDQPLLNGVPISATNEAFYVRTYRHVHHHRKRYFALWLLAALSAVSIVLGLFYYHKNKHDSPAPGEGEFLLTAVGKKHGDEICESDRSYPVAILLSIFLGYVGVDRFYLGYIISALLKLITGGGFGIWYIIDIVLIVIGGLPDHNGCSLIH
ncbi:TM2 domain-containing protein [Gamsiella multidivaricata]|uniref:TM2 domain-containing protein n=1 Tax=Gamsiella multidivaricata TaxID=101098 RepID=UPI00221F27D4|nr:TM2 domain-containing protein [Gamsiella multidivaricata]KAG0354626.1 hypothetical protein BGZ54_001559 [Gamsiella multidivaricata]KAI7819213.1 TM2 domain-containing protein [Gamsiella multidivaricata]